MDCNTATRNMLPWPCVSSDHPALTGSPPNSGGEEVTKGRQLRA